MSEVIPPIKKIRSFFSACYQIGRELARAGCHVVLGSNRYSTADYHVMRGLRSIKGTHIVSIVRPYDERFLSDDRERISSSSEFKEESELGPGNLKIEFVPVRGPWGTGRVTQLIHCDAVIVIGGKSGTSNIIEIAPELRRPVVAVPSFGGAARDTWTNLAREYGSFAGSSHDLYTLADRWHDGNAKTVVELAIKLGKNNPYEDRSWRSFVYLAAGIFSLIAAWAAIFSYPCDWWFTSTNNTCSNNRPTMFLLFWLSAFIGTGLRAAKRIADDPTEQTSGAVIFIEGAIGLSVSFGLSLLYMAGLFLAANSSDLFPLLSDKPSDFRRTAVLMSTISFASAFLLEGSFAKLQEKLREKVMDEG